MEIRKSLEEARYHAWFHHNDSDGWITVAKKTKNGLFRQYHYRPQELAEKLTEWLGEDVFFSQNTFYKPQREIANIRQLKALYVDLDFYLFNYDHDWIIGKLEFEYFGQTIPEPNIIIFSGQGMVLIWLIEPVPYKALPLWQAVQNHFLKILSDLGGDPRAVDAARVFRIAGSVNSKNGAEVKAQYRHKERYVLKTLQYEYLPELEVSPKLDTPKKKGRKKKVQQLFNIYRLHHARMLDLVKLVELREYDVTGYRETILFLYRYWLCCFLNDPVEALNQAHTLNLQFTQPLPFQEVEKATRSAEKAYNARNNEEANRIAKEKGYPGAGYNISNKKLIEWLDITSSEMMELRTIIDANEKRRRKRIANMEKRREEGVKSREEYLKEQRKRTENKIDQLKELIKVCPGQTKKEYAEMMGISERHLRRLQNKL
ncbi:replication protein [Caldibacillus thermoamylovorans]|uniref:replication protein n=1 Tax=Caldibacillus thermoamylovorans TaxID=35841 RepID=UPI00203FB9CF|nr:replication protein [Caldibacillus thermoamylovorans]MCM3800050.1 replication protein [Caldibacillus thermoamylovorans]